MEQMKGMILYYSKNKGNWERTLVAITYFYNIYHRSSVPYFFCLLQKRERLFRVYCKAYYFSHKFQVNLQLRDLKYDRKIHDFEIKKRFFFKEVAMPASLALQNCLTQPIREKNTLS